MSSPTNSRTVNFDDVDSVSSTTQQLANEQSYRSHTPIETLSPSSSSEEEREGTDSVEATAIAPSGDLQVVEIPKSKQIPLDANTTPANQQDCSPTDKISVATQNKIASTTDDVIDEEAPPTAPVETHTKLAIRDLHPFLLNDWILHARVVACGEAVRWATERSSGTRVTVHFMDANGDMMKATVFNEAVNRYLPILTAGSTCSFSNAQVKFANRAFSHDVHELSIDSRSSIVSIPSDAVPSADIRSCTNIKDIGQLPQKTIVTMLGVITRVGPEKRLTTKKGQDTAKREILVVDQSGAQLVCVLWGAHAKSDLSSMERTPVLIRHGEINDYNDTRSLNVGTQTALLLDPAVKETSTLMAWFDANVDRTDFQFVRPPLNG